MPFLESLIESSSDIAQEIGKPVVAFPMSYEEMNSAFRDVALPNDMVMKAVKQACEFFNLPEVPVVDADDVCVWRSGDLAFNDDVFGFNRQQLADMGVRGQDSLTLVYTHECAHRVFQGKMDDAWKEELACDFFAGVNAGLNNINLDNVEAALGSCIGSPTHPNGALRASFIEEGYRMANEMGIKVETVTFENGMAQFEQYFQDKAGLIGEYRDRFDPYHFSIDD